MSGKKSKSLKKLKKSYIFFFVITLLLIGILFFSITNIKLMEYTKNNENKNNIVDDIITDDNSLKIDIEENLNEIKLNVKKALTVESGDVLPDLEDYFIEDNIDDVYFLHYYNKDGNELDYSSFTYTKDSKIITKGKHEIGIIIKKEDERFDSTLIIEDTTPPNVKLKELTINSGDKYFAIDFIESYSDNSSESEYIVKFLENPSNNKSGEYDIVLNICDLSNNCITQRTILKILSNENEPDNGNGNANNNDNNENNNEEDNNNNIDNDNNNSNNDNDLPNSNNTDDDANSSSNEENTDDENEELTSEEKEPNIPPTYVETKTEERTISTENRYGTLIHKIGNVTYELYSDESIVILDTSNIRYVVDYAGYNGTTAQLKSEAIQVYNNSESVRNNVLSKTNEYRTEAGVHSLVIDEELSIMASIRAMELAYSNTFAHLRPNGDSWSTLWKEYGYNFTAGSLYGENLALNYSSDFTACEGWKNSKAHYANMINSKYNKLGVGKFYFNGKTYWVQLFSS